MRQQQAAEMPIGEVFVPKQHPFGCLDNLIIIWMPSICKTLFWCHIMSPGHPAGREDEKGVAVLKEMRTKGRATGQVIPYNRAKAGVRTSS